MRRWLVNAVAFGVLWLFVRGVPLDATRIAEEGLIGLAVGLPIALGLRRFYRGPPTARTVRVAPSIVLYVLTFLKELLVANVAVARVVLSPSMPIEPAVVEVPLRVESDAAVTTIANSITLTPGTLTMDYDADANSLYVHSIAASDADDVIGPIRSWEDYALVIFEERATPDDPAPVGGGSRE